MSTAAAKTAKLDQSLDEILSGTRRVAGKGRPRGRRAPAAGRTAPPAGPVGGVRKTSKAAPSKIIPTGPGGNESRIQVSNLPKDIDEKQIKEYFTKTVGAIKRAELFYGPGGVSRGIATILFASPDAARKATQTLNGVLADGKPLKIDVIIDARRAATIPPPKGLSERIVAPKSQPKSAASTKASSAATVAGTRGKGNRGRTAARGGRAAGPRPTKKTAEELDSEMADYFESGGNAGETGVTNGAQPAGDAMDDEIL